MSSLVPMSSFLTNDNTKKYLESILGNKTQTFITSLSTMVGNDNKLNLCDRKTILGCALKATSMNLPFDPNLGFAYAIPYGNQAQFQMGYKGYIQLAQRSGKVAKLNVREVYEGELVDEDMFGEPVLKWIPLDERENKKIIGYCAGLQLTNGFIKVIFWSTEKVQKHAEKYSQAYKYAKKVGQKDAIWITDFDKMAKKTVLKDLLKTYAPMSVEMEQVIKYDQAVILSDPDTGTEKLIYVDNSDVSIEETILKEQQEEIAKIIGDNDELWLVITDKGYNTLQDIPLSEYENIVLELKEKCKSKK